MQGRLKYLAKNTTIFAIGELGTKLINFFLVPFYTHVLSTEQYGTVDLIFTISTVIVPLVMFNIGEAIMRYAMDTDSDHDKLFSIAAIVFAFGVTITLVIFPATSIIPDGSKFSILSKYSVYLYAYVILCATKSVLTSFLRGKEQLKTYVACNLINTALIALFNIYFLVILKLGIKGYLLAYIFAELIAVIFAFFFGKMYRHLFKFSFDFRLTKQMIAFSLAVVPNSLLWWVMNSSDRLMVTAMCNVSENGILAVAYKLPSLLTMMNTIMMQAWKFSAIKEKDSQDGNDFANRMFAYFFRGSVIIAATMIVAIKFMTKILFAEAYYISWEASIFLLLGFVFMGLGTFVGTIYYVEKNMVGNMLSALIGAICNILLNYLLIPKMGASGATLAACISYFAILVYRYFDTKKYQELSVFNGNNIIMILALICMIVLQMVEVRMSIFIIIAVYIALIALNKTYIFSLIKKILKYKVFQKGD